MNDLGPGICLKAFLPGWDEGGVGDDFAGRIDGSDVFENIVGNAVFRRVGHEVINAFFAGISKSSLCELVVSSS